jgi:hypothetical protein
LESLGQASLLHSGRPSVVIVGAGAAPLLAMQPSVSLRATHPARADHPVRRVAALKP